MLDHLSKYDIILGSQSPRRQELLAGLNINFRVESIYVEETYPETLVGVDIPMYLAQKKALAFTLEENTMLITADTIVWHEGAVYGKPDDWTDAKRMLLTLSGKMHQVITGVCITTKRKRRVFHVISDVYFARFNEAEVDYYLENYEPYDKAGSYGVQEWIGYIGIEYIQGSFYNVMGLPTKLLWEMLEKITQD